MGGLAFKLVIGAFCLVGVLTMAANALRNARKLNHRIREFKKEQEELTMRRGPIDPYAALSDLYTQDKEPGSRRPGEKPRR